jgi:hypothetical protein
MQNVIDLASHRDAAILNLYRQWLAQRAALAAFGPEDSAEYDAAVEQWAGTQARIMATPAAGHVGLAVKVLLTAHDAQEFGVACLDSLIRDAAALVPDIAP